MHLVASMCEQLTFVYELATGGMARVGGRAGQTGIDSAAAARLVVDTHAIESAAGH